MGEDIGAVASGQVEMGGRAGGDGEGGDVLGGGFEVIGRDGTGDGEGLEVVFAEAMGEVGMEVREDEDRDVVKLATDVGSDGVMVTGVEVIRKAMESVDMEDIDADGEAGVELED